MNKKFSTLVAGAALLLGAVSANAQVGFDSDIKLKEGQSENLYQIKIKDGYLTINETGKLDTVKTVTSKNLARTLWCVTVGKEEQGQHPKFDFMNKGAQAYLDVTMEGLKGADYAPNAFYPAADTAIVGGEIGGWAYSSVYKNGIETNKPLYSYFTPDSVVGIVLESGVVKLKKTSALGTDIATQFTDSVSLVKADAIELNAEEINTVLGSQKADAGVDLSFAPDVVGTDLKNPFKEGKFLVTPATITNTTTIDGNFVNVLTSDSSYLYVDTTYTNDVGAAKFLAYKWADLTYANLQKSKAATKPASAQDSILKNELTDQFKFLFTYYPTNDSLEIQVKEVLFQDGSKAFKGTGIATDSVYVSLQELVTNKTRILTVDSVAQNTYIKFGYKGCGTVASDKKSADNGLYVIYNAKGQVLASPIHKNGTTYEWVTLDAQTPEHMPAYQWLVQKTQNSESLKETSPIILKNREFSHTATVQLREVDGKIVADAFNVNGFAITDGTAVQFEQIKDSTILKDPYLGYKKFDKDSLTIAQYKFNYLHKFEKNSWIKRGEGKDSVLYAIKDDYTAFNITEGNVDATYGAAAPNVAGLKGIAQLKRTQYLVSLKADTVGVGAEDRIVLGQVQKDSVYFKENNHFDGNHYYAMLESDAATNAISTTKISVSDAGVSAYLQSQPLEEATTSAFAIKVDDVPLYRRFNSSLENAVAGQEDSTKILKFKEYYRGEYLMDENNPKFQDAVVNYLGIERADKATGLSFYVDTAILNSTKAGYIKPQYFIYLNPEIQPAVPATPCPLDHNHGVDANGNPLDAYHCSHAEAGKPGYMKAQYLVSFADSVSRPAADADKLYKFGEYTRVGFVDGLRMGDSLYILTNGFEKLALADLDTAKIKAAYKAAKIEFNIIDLKAERNDEHHNYTWSFRFVDPEKAANLVEEDRRFLIESAKKTGDKDIAPEYGAWLKSQNGCLVLSDKATSEFDNTKTGGDNALIFNIENGSKDDLATDNEEIATSEVAVIAGEGQVRIANAEGKKVVITNILGQTVANTVITSSDAVIAAPQGVVVVAVEGEEAVKAIVK